MAKIMPSNSNEVVNAQEGRIWDILMWGSLGLLFVLMTVMSFSYGLSGDEVDMNEYGKAILNYFTSFGKDTMVLNMPKEYNRDGVMQFYGGFFDLICAIVNKFSPFEEYTTRHILNAWAGFLGIMFAGKIAMKAFGKQVALFCMWLMFLSPFFLGHAMNNPKDVPFATAYIVSIYYIIRFFEFLPKPKWQHYVSVILSIGITIDIRVGGILLLPYMFVYSAMIYVFKVWFGKETIDLKTWIRPLAIVAVGGYLAGSLFWPYGQLNPISNPLTALHEMSNFKVSIAQLFEGTKVPSDELPGNFLIKSFMITNSYAWLVGILLSIGLVLQSFKSKQASLVLFIVFTGLFPIFYIIYTHANVYHGWRHVMFAFPSLCIVSAGGWWYAQQYLAKRKFKYGLALGAVLLLEPAAFIASSYPNTICYFNTFAGGVKGAYCNYEMDYYYNSVKQSVDYFKANEMSKIKPGTKVTIASNCAHLLLQYFKKDTAKVNIMYVRYPQRNQKLWDYSIFHIALIPDEELKAVTWMPPTTMFKSEVDGCALSALAKRPSYADYDGFMALERNHVDTALQAFEAYLKVDSENIEMINIMANIYHQLGRDDIANKYSTLMKQYLSVAE